MRVLTVGNMYPPHHLGGYELMWRSSVAHLRSRGHEVRVLTTDFRVPVPEAGIDEDENVHRELRWYWRNHEWPRLTLRERLRLERGNLATLRRHLADVRPDVVAWWAMGGMSMSLLEEVRAGRIPAVGVVVDDWLLYAPKEDQWQRFARRLGPARRALGPLTGVPSRIKVDDDIAWVLVSQEIADHARSGGWRLRDSVVAHGGVDSSLFRAHPESGDWAGKLLYVGRVDPRKGVETAVRCLAALPGASLRVIGGGDEDHLVELRSLVGALGLEDRVSFERRPRHLLPAAYAEADAVLFPVVWEEPWGLVPLEAMAVGTPVVATGTGGSGEYLRHGENCLLFPPGDHAALADAVRRLAADPALRSRLRDGGLATAARLDEDSFNLAVANVLDRVAEA